MSLLLRRYCDGPCINTIVAMSKYCYCDSLAVRLNCNHVAQVPHGCYNGIAQVMHWFCNVTRAVLDKYFTGTTNLQQSTALVLCRWVPPVSIGLF